MNQIQLEVIKYIINSEPEYEGTPYQHLGLWEGFKHTLWIMFHPWESQRQAVRLTKQNIIDRIQIRYQEPK